MGIALAAMVAIAIPLSAATSLAKSQAEVRASNLTAGLRDALDAQPVEPFAAAPRLQEALVLEAQHRLGAAATAASAATERGPDD